MPAVAIVPAAGKAERFGGAKLVADLNGRPLIDWTIASLLDAGVAHVVVVVAPGADLQKSGAKSLADPRVTIVVNSDPSRGMLSSIQAGLETIDGDPILFIPADMPFVASNTVSKVIDACVRGRRLVVPVHRNRRGHPIAIPNSMRRAVLDAAPTSTLKVALAPFAAAGEELPVDDAGVLRDVDVRDDLRT